MIGKFYAQARAYTAKFYALAKNKLTTYIALGTAGLSELLGSWDQAAAVLPHWVISHKAHLVAVSALTAVWSRIRKDL
jgi:hypothetical protein